MIGYHALMRQPEGENKMIKDYQDFKKEIQKKNDDFLNENAFFAFNKEQFIDGVKKLNITSNKELVKIGAGGYLLKSKVNDFIVLKKECDHMEKEFKKDIDKLKQMIIYELANHEYIVHEDLTDTLEACNISKNEAKKPYLNNIIKKCVKEYMASVEY